jgi:hypothetical protein
VQAADLIANFGVLSSIVVIAAGIMLLQTRHLTVKSHNRSLQSLGIDSIGNALRHCQRAGTVSLGSIYVNGWEPVLVMRCFGMLSIVHMIMLDTLTM